MARPYHHGAKLLSAFLVSEPEVMMQSVHEVGWLKLDELMRHSRLVRPYGRVE
jgi:hypothetical protein